MSDRRLEVLVRAADGRWEATDDDAPTVCVRCGQAAARCGCTAAQRDAAVGGLVEEPEITVIGLEDLEEVRPAAPPPLPHLPG